MFDSMNIHCFGYYLLIEIQNIQDAEIVFISDFEEGLWSLEFYRKISMSAWGIFNIT